MSLDAAWCAQFDVVRALCDHHLDRLTDDELSWVPAPLHWTVHRTAEGWEPDFPADGVEPDPVPAPTAAWVAWHLLWWWGTASAELAGRAHPAASPYPGSAAAVAAALRERAAVWRAELERADPHRPVAFPWPEGRTVADLVGWAHVELTKNVAELGQLRVLRGAGAGGAAGR
ncbi:DinB family protein [Pseudonocardia spirodelae]|uniref:DinB family protein n=1 Tax=Pseudonocardia spirodelae TaxID=3133431 RepID=A0ABU8T8Y6_9PSEU